jgi:carbon storage regulator CsrA
MRKADVTELRCNMTTNETVPSQSLVRSAAFRVVRLLVFGLIGWLLFVSAADSAWRGVTLAAVLALAALVGITWYLSRARAERHWRAALDAYAKQEQAKRHHSRRNFRARRKIGERIVVPHSELAVTVLAIEDKAVRLGVSAPVDLGVYRLETWRRLQRETRSPHPNG